MKAVFEDDHLVSPDWLEAHLADDDLVILDCTWYIPEANKSGRAEFDTEHIPDARYFDLTAFSDAASPYANMLPSVEIFEKLAGRLGIDSNSCVIVYDKNYVSARVWWMFLVFGHQRVRVLDGGFRRWKAEGRPLRAGSEEAVAATTFLARVNRATVADWREVLRTVQTGEALLLDARSPERFTGTAGSGYPGVPGGHMPGAVNLCWDRMIVQSDGFRFAAREEAARLFREAGLDPSRPVIATCGSGVTAAVLAFQLSRLGLANWKIYDGSWHEWGQRDDLPKEPT
jgi:thiosulfate/3-mercaptopyruvate sulfurtransferase